MNERGQVTGGDGLEVALGGVLSCAGCAYDLSGLSIRGVCPECGLAVRATILAVVDPAAEELLPMVHPHRLGASIVAWSGGAAVAAAVAWVPHVLMAVGAGVRTAWVVGVMLVCVGVSWCGGWGLVRLYRDRGAGRDGMWVAVGCVVYVALGVLLWVGRGYWGVDDGGGGVGGGRGGGGGYVPRWLPREEGLWLQMGVMGCVAAIALCFHGQARRLVARSLVMRQGRVDRQTLFATAGAAAVVMLGDAVALGRLAWRDGAWGSSTDDLVGVMALVLVVLGQVLVTIGLVGGMVDGWRIRRAIVRPAPSMGHVTRKRETRRRETSEREAVGGVGGGAG